uniref:Uncharacterized protein n=1 Tax=Glossina palpalis gambiensis TaxID=67801 RepID=A0A1B0B0Y9_9MUSC
MSNYETTSCCSEENSKTQFPVDISPSGVEDIREVEKESNLNYTKNETLSEGLFQSFINESFDAREHLAYWEYKKAGEYWNTTPKTDYTYSKFSTHRRVLAPGIIAMPNMSRQSLGGHNDRVRHMIEQDPAREEYILQRYANVYDVERQCKSWLACFIISIIGIIGKIWNSLMLCPGLKRNLTIYSVNVRIAATQTLESDFMHSQPNIVSRSERRFSVYLIVLVSTLLLICLINLNTLSDTVQKSVWFLHYFHNSIFFYSAN